MATTNNWFDRLDETAETWASIAVEETSPTADSATVTYNLVNAAAVISDTQVYYNVDSTIGQVTGGASFPFASVLSDLTPFFNVYNAQVEKDLVVSYSGRESLDVQLYATWRNLSGVETDKEVTYGLGGYVDGPEEEWFYRVLVGAEQDLTDTYVVVGQVLSDSATVAWEIYTTPMTATQSVVPTYSILQGVERDTVSSYSVLNQTESDYTDTFNVLTGTEKDVALSYNVSGTVIAALVCNFNIGSNQPVYMDYQFAFTVNSEIVVVPNVLGMPLSEATATITGAGLPLGTVTYTTLQ